MNFTSLKCRFSLWFSRGSQRLNSDCVLTGGTSLTCAKQYILYIPSLHIKSMGQKWAKSRKSPITYVQWETTFGGWIRFLKEMSCLSSEGTLKQFETETESENFTFCFIPESISEIPQTGHEYVIVELKSFAHTDFDLAGAQNLHWAICAQRLKKIIEVSFRVGKMLCKQPRGTFQKMKVRMSRELSVSRYQGVI